jgi:hypothetical protein
VALRAHARGLYHAEAAVELLIGHPRWLGCEAFVDRFVSVGQAMVGEVVLAVVDWQAAVEAMGGGRLACSRSEGCVLRIAARIAGGVPVDLGDCLSSLDETNVGLVVEAVLHANGRRGAGGATR